MRTLIAELGDAYCDELERTAIGPFRLEDADSERIVPLGEALEFLPKRVLDEQEAVAVRHGRRVPGGAQYSAHLRLVHDDELLAIAEPRGDELKPVVVFAPA